MKTYKLSNDIVILQILIKVINHLEVIDKVILTINDNKYTFNSLAEYHWQFKRIREPYTRYTIFVDNLDRLYALDKELQQQCLLKDKPQIKTVDQALDEKGNRKIHILTEVRTRLPKQDIYRNLNRMLSNGIDGVIGNIKIYKTFLEAKREEYGQVYRIPRTVGRIEKNKLKEALMWDTEWQKYTEQTQVINEQMFNDMVKCKTGGLYGNCKPWNYVIKDCISYDKKSAYPSIMLTRRFPIGKPHIIENPDMDYYTNLIKQKQYLIVFKAYGLIEIHKAKMNYREKDFNNGVVMTNDEFDVFRHLYLYDTIKVERLYVWNRSVLLPKVFRHYLANLYLDKETCSKDDPERDIKKIRLNLWYGLTLQYLSYDYSKLKPNKYGHYFYIPPVIGLWTVGYQMKDMVEMLDKIDYKNLVKFDTDSITFTGKHNIVHFENANQNLKKILYNIYEDNKLDKLGSWELEYEDDIILFGNKQYAKINKQELKASGCITNKDSYNQVMKDGIIRDGMIKYDPNNNQIIRRDYSVNNKTWEGYMYRC